MAFGFALAIFTIDKLDFYDENKEWYSDENYHWVDIIINNTDTLFSVICILWIR